MTESSDQDGLADDIGTVAVLGCGNMGAALARALLTSGRQVRVWNRTEQKAQALVRLGALACTDAADAAGSADLVVVCLGTTEDVRAVLHSIDVARLAGRIILNVTTGAPEDAQLLNEWALSSGVDYLDGAIGAYPEQIGTEDARILVAGSEDLWSAVRGTVTALAGASMHVGVDHSAANVIDAAMTGAFYISSLVSFTEAARFMRDLGVKDDVLAELIGYSTGVLAYQMLQIVRRLETGDFQAQEASLNVYADAAEAFAAGMASFGDASMITATASVLRRAVDAGLGERDMAVLASSPAASF